jgi:Uma2 family endonuclease
VDAWDDGHSRKLGKQVVAMGSALWAPDHLLSSDDWYALDREPYLHYELSDGVLVMTPRPAPRHQYVVKRVADALEDQLPSALVPLIDVEVPIRRGPAATHRAPDVVVVPRAVLALDSPLVDPAEVLLAVEVVSPGSVSTDRILKVQEYASVGIPAYLIIDLMRHELIAHELKGSGTYAETAGAPASFTVAGHGVHMTWEQLD